VLDRRGGDPLATAVRFRSEGEVLHPTVPLEIFGCDACGLVDWRATSLQGVEALSDVIQWTPPTPCPGCGQTDAWLCRWVADAVVGDSVQVARPAAKDWTGWDGKLRVSVCVGCRFCEWAARGLEEMDPMFDSERLPGSCARCRGRRHRVRPLESGAEIRVHGMILETDICEGCGALDWHGTLPPATPPPAEKEPPKRAPRERKPPKDEEPAGRSEPIGALLTKVADAWLRSDLRGLDRGRLRLDANTVSLPVTEGSLTVWVRSGLDWTVEITADLGQEDDLPTRSSLVRLAIAIRRILGRTTEDDFRDADDAAWAASRAPGAKLLSAPGALVLVIPYPDEPSVMTLVETAQAAYVRLSGRVSSLG
jgi:hypothetical protein